MSPMETDSIILHRNLEPFRICYCFFSGKPCRFQSAMQNVFVNVKTASKILPKTYIHIGGIRIIE